MLHVQILFDNLKTRTVVSDAERRSRMDIKILITNLINETEDEGLLDLIYKLLLTQCTK